MSGQERPGDDGEGLVTAAVAATLLAVSVRSVRRYAEEGRLAPVRLGRNVRYRLADVERLIATGADTSGHEGRQDGRRAADTPVTPDTGQGRPGADMSALADVSVRTVEALREELAALRVENTTLREELTAKAEAAGLWQGRARTLETQLQQISASAEQPDAAQDGPGAAERSTVVESAPAGVWGRVRRWWSR